MFGLGINFVVWHYTQAVKELCHNILNVLWFLYHFFSIPLLFSTLFYPWRGMGEAYGPVNIFHLGDALSSLAVNFLMRIVGFFARSAIIIFGIVVLVVSFVLSILLLIIWLLLPLIMIFIFISALRLIFE